ESTTFAVEPATTSGKVWLVLRADQAEDANNQPVTLPGGVRRVEATLSYNPACMGLLDAKGSGPFTQLAWNDASGTVTITSDLPSAAASAQPPFEWARLLLRLKGSATATCTLQASALTSYRADLTPGAQSWPAKALLGLPFLRGDANGSGSVSLADAVAVLQYLVGLKSLGQISPLNAASVKQDTPATPPDTGDHISLSDAVLLLRYLVGLVDEFFNLITATSTPTPTPTPTPASLTWTRQFVFLGFDMAPGASAGRSRQAYMVGRTEGTGFRRQRAASQR
ncbi:MAG: hypothetical protein HY686_03120, partial [Chloroflexi bacterium]|nr:hypothetical protein [Chloroflexota bacterium]